MSTQSGSSLDATERRQFARHRVKSLAYLDIGADNGGIVLNVSEGGLAVHAVAALPPEPTIGLRLQLPRSTKRLEAQAKVAWTSGSKKDAGVEFIDLSEEARREIRDWLAAENLQEPVYAERAPQIETPPARRPARTDKWTSLVAALTSEGATPAPAASPKTSLPPTTQSPATTTPAAAPPSASSSLQHSGNDGGAEIHEAPATPAPAISAAEIPRAAEGEGSFVASSAGAIEREVREPAPVEAESTVSVPAAFETSVAEPGVFAPSTAGASVAGATEPEENRVAASADETQAQLARELTMEEALSGNLAESRAGIFPDGEAGFISNAALPETEPETVASVEPPERTLNAELSLPSDTLLNSMAPPFHAPTTQPFTVVSGGGGGEKSTGVNRSRFVRDSVRNAPTSDDFLKKARSLFGPNRGAGQFPESEEPADGPVAVPEPAKEFAAVEESAPPPAAAMTSAAQPFAAALPSDLPAVEIPAPVESIPTAVSELRRAEVRASVARPRPAARGFELRSTMGVLALCVIVAFVCVGLGIAVGRVVFAPTAPVAVSGTGAPSAVTPPAASDSRNAPPENPSSAATDSRENTRASKQSAQARRGRPSRAGVADSGRGNADDADSASVAPADEDRSAAASQPENGNRSAAAAPQSSAGSYKISATPSMPVPTPALAPAAAASNAAGSAPTVHDTIGHDTGARPQPPPERVVSAHLMYRVEPFYPKDAIREHVEGIVKIHATVGVDGTVKNLRVVSGPGLLGSAALDAAQYWRYIPALRNGQPVESEEEINIEFHLPH
jgi:TonB family protein